MENGKKSVLLRLDEDDLLRLDRLASKAGLSRQKFTEHVLHGVLNLDCRPSEYEPIRRAYQRE